MARVELGIDSASLEAAVALLDGDKLLIEHRWTVETNYSRELLGGIDAALREAGVERATSWRRSRSTRGRAATRACAAAWRRRRGWRSRSASRSRASRASRRRPSRSSVAGGRWSPRTTPAAAASPGPPTNSGDGNAAPVVVEAPRLDELDACLRAAPRGARWCGELSEELLAALPGIEGVAAPATENVRLAADLVRLARLHEAYDDPALVDVVYLRPPPITRAAARTRTS